MKAWKVTEPKTVEEIDWTEPPFEQGLVQTRITKSVLTMGDVLNFAGMGEFNAVIPGSYGIGKVTEIEDNIFDIKRGDRVYIAPTDNCGECYNCIEGSTKRCSNFKIAGDNADGFLKDFCVKPLSDIYRLPDAVDDTAALFIEYVAKSLSIIDSLNIKKGDHVAVICAGSLGNILSQLMIYYQSVPILIDSDASRIEAAKKSGIFYALNADEDLQKKVNEITGGRFCDGVVFITESEVPPKTAFNLASCGTPIVVSGTTYKSPKIDLTPALKKQLNIMCVSNGFGNIFSAINLIANKAVKFDYLNFKTANYADVPEILKSGAQTVHDKKPFINTIINLV